MVEAEGAPAAKPPYLLALDQGTSSSRSIVFDRHGQVVALAQRELQQIYPEPGWVEHDPMAIWRDQLATAREAITKAGLRAQDIHAIGITNQRETTLLWDRQSGEPMHHAIVWQDRRTAPLCEQLRSEGWAAHIAERTGLVPDAYFSATKLAWLLDHIPGARTRAERGELAFGTVDSWLIWQLTGGRVHATDVTNAARTLLFDIRRNRWDGALLDRLQIPASLLPEVRPSSGHVADADPALFGCALPIFGVAGDQQSALFGQACLAPGMVKNTYGTGCFMLMHAGAAFRESKHGLLTTRVAGPLTSPEFAIEGSVFVGGAVVQWLRDGLRAISSSAEVGALAGSVPDSGGVVVVPAFTGLGAPYWQPDARGTITGLTRGSTIAHVARAALESIAFQSAALLAAMRCDLQDAGVPAPTELRVDGGASVNDLLMQFQADLLGIAVVRPRVTETTALGAACLAGLASGVFASEEELSTLWQIERRFLPTMSRDEAAARLARWERAVRQATAP